MRLLRICDASILAFRGSWDCGHVWRFGALHIHLGALGFNVVHRIMNPKSRSSECGKKTARIHLPEDEDDTCQYHSGQDVFSEPSDAVRKGKSFRGHGVALYSYW